MERLKLSSGVIQLSNITGLRPRSEAEMKKFKIGDLVRIKGFPFTHHTGKIIDRKRHFLSMMWVVELDQPATLGQRFFRGADKNLTLI